MEEIIKALELKQQLDSLRPIDKEQEAKIMQKFRLDWNYHSNNLEGNSLTYGETKALIMFGVTAQGKPLKDHFEVTGHNEAINWVIEVVNGDRPLTESFIRELHTLLLKESYEVDAVTPDGKPTKKRIKVGSYKSSPNHVQTKTGEMFYFATPEETPSKMADLMAWYNEKIEEDNVNPILLASEFHYKFIRIHPFDDGNGRTARILMNFILMKFGYPPVIIKTEDKANYFAALQLADAGSLEGFIEYIAKNLNHSLDIMIAGAKGESIEEPDDIGKEIALLEKRLNALGERSNVIKSRESLMLLIDKVILKIYNRIIERSGKLSKLYIEHALFLSSPQIQDKLISAGEMKNKISTAYKEIKLFVFFNKFTSVGFNEFSYSSALTIKLALTHYSILDENETLLLEKPYGLDLTDEQLDKIALSQVKRHKDFIEQKIAEKENGQ
jgi:Fic family protein